MYPVTEWLLFFGLLQALYVYSFLVQNNETKEEQGVGGDERLRVLGRPLRVTADRKSWSGPGPVGLGPKTDTRELVSFFRNTFLSLSLNACASDPERALRTHPVWKGRACVNAECSTVVYVRVQCNNQLSSGYETSVIDWWIVTHATSSFFSIYTELQIVR